MAIGNSYLTSVRQYMRLSTKAHDNELKDLINAARADLALGGVLEEKTLDEKDPLILRAVATYVKAEFGLDNEDAEKYRASYKEQRNALALSDSYIKAEEEG
ncbi:MAG: head-tail connector protein [Lachnospiraceae bacterium]|nr:head-tail connector protein [Lachnospiraceae bacterium]